MKYKEILMKCKEHPSYLAKREPITACPVCWSIWVERITEPARLARKAAKAAYKTGRV